MKRDTHFTWHPVEAANVDLTGKQVAIVGGTGGIGQALSRCMAARGANITVVGQTFRDTDLANIQFIKANLSLMSEAQRVSQALPAENFDLLIFTTGIFAAPKRQATAEGIERDMAISYLSRLVILRGMAQRLGTARPTPQGKPRIFIMGYPGAGQAGRFDDLNAEKSYSAMAVHMNTVAGNEMLVLDAAKRYPHVLFFGLNPGLIKTNIRRNFLGANKLFFGFIEWMIGLMTPSADAYAQRITALLFTPDIDAHSGMLFNRKGQAILPSASLTDEHIQQFMLASETLVAKTGVALATC